MEGVPVHEAARFRLLQEIRHVPSGRMIPIQDVLHRIQWDPAWRASRFDIGYLDRVAGTILRVPFGELRLEAGGLASLMALDADGAVLTIPLHRVRQVWRDGALIWERRPDEAIQSRHGRDPHD
jgi:uncharacterized protein (UPF0248 family)